MGVACERVQLDLPFGEPRSITTLRLFRLRQAVFYRWPDEIRTPLRAISPSGGSILITSAPRSVSSNRNRDPPAYGRSRESEICRATTAHLSVFAIEATTAASGISLVICFHPQRIEIRPVLGWNRAAKKQRNVAGPQRLETGARLLDQIAMAARQHAEAYRVDIPVDRDSGDTVRRLAQAGVDHLRAGIAGAPARSLSLRRRGRRGRAWRLNALPARGRCG